MNITEIPPLARTSGKTKKKKQVITRKEKNNLWDIFDTDNRDIIDI
jgi:hypothetical protein